MQRKHWRWLGLLLVAAAIANELRKPVGERTWHDRLLGVLPYDVRPPTLARVKQTLWDPQNERILVPQAFGVGWSLNVGGLLQRLGLLRSR